jgi:putative salt-induced outer membrane protein YdiY
MVSLLFFAVKQVPKKIKVAPFLLITILSIFGFLSVSYANDASATIPVEDKRITWKKEVAIGYNRVTGNTRESQISGSFLINRNNKHVNEWALKGNAYYSSNNRKMNSQKWYSNGRYAYSFGSTKKWYNFYNMEADHDRFADIDYRLIPSAGIGYWFYDIPEFKLMAEAGIGYEHTAYRTDIENKGKWILIPRAFLEKQLFANTTIIQDLFYYPAFENFNNYRLHSETILNVAMNSKLSIRVSLLNEYNSAPPKDVKKNDLRLTTSLAYSF